MIFVSKKLLPEGRWKKVVKTAIEMGGSTRRNFWSSEKNSTRKFRWYWDWGRLSWCPEARRKEILGLKRASYISFREVTKEDKFSSPNEVTADSGVLGRKRVIRNIGQRAHRFCFISPETRFGWLKTYNSRTKDPEGRQDRIMTTTCPPNHRSRTNTGMTLNLGFPMNTSNSVSSR